MAEETTATAATAAPKGKKGKGKGKGGSSKPKEKKRKGSEFTVEGITVKITPVGGGGNRYTVEGYGLCPVLRWCGAHEWSNARCMALLTALRLEGVASKNTVQCQAGSARAAANGGTNHHPGELAEFTAKQAKLLEKLAPEA